MSEQMRQEAEPGFVESLKSTVRHREFTILATMLFLYQSACICMTGSVNYVVNGVLGMPARASYSGSATH